MKKSCSRVSLFIGLVLVLIFGASAKPAAPAKLKSSSSGFLILVETTKEGLKLSGKKGCAWTTLAFDVKQDQPQSVDQFGLRSPESRNHRANRKLTNFLLLIKKTKDGISIEGKEGTAWETLNFDCPKSGCSQYINFNGMSAKTK